MGATAGESDNAEVLALAFKRTSGTNEEQGSATIVTKTASFEDNNDAESLSANNTDDAIMQLLPSACQQGILCRVRPLTGQGDGAIRGDVVVFLGSTLRGAGVFSGMDGAWFERVCAHLALGAAAAGSGGGERWQRDKLNIMPDGNVRFRF